MRPAPRVPMPHEIERVGLQAGTENVGPNDADIAQPAPLDFGTRHIGEASSLSNPMTDPPSPTRSDRRFKIPIGPQPGRPEGSARLTLGCPHHQEPNSIRGYIDDTSCWWSWPASPVNLYGHPPCVGGSLRPVEAIVSAGFSCLSLRAMSWRLITDGGFLAIV